MMKSRKAKLKQLSPTLAILRWNTMWACPVLKNLATELVLSTSSHLLIQLSLCLLDIHSLPLHALKYCVHIEIPILSSAYNRASVLGELWRLEPLTSQKNSMWHREMEWILCVSDSIFEIIPAWQGFPEGGSLEVIVSRPHSYLYIDLPALRKLDAMLLLRFINLHR
eukprot:Gb_12220 [translate_table: standard]